MWNSTERSTERPQGVIGRSTKSQQTSRPDCMRPSACTASLRMPKAATPQWEEETPPTRYCTRGSIHLRHVPPGDEHVEHMVFTQKETGFSRISCSVELPTHWSSNNVDWKQKVNKFFIFTPRSHRQKEDIVRCVSTGWFAFQYRFPKR